MTPPDPLPMKSMRVMTSDIRYTGVTYAPFTTSLPSEQSTASESSSGRPTGSVRRGFGKPDEIGKSEEYPIGEPWILVIFAILFAGFIAWKNKTSKELHLHYQKNNSNMKNTPSIKSARNWTKVGIKSVVNATKVLSPILLFAFLTLGFGQICAACYILGPDGSWDQNTTHQMVSSGITNWVYKDLSVKHGSDWSGFKVYNGSTWYGKDSGGNNVTVGTIYSPTTSGGDTYCDFKANGLTYYFFFNTSTYKLMIQPKYYLAGTCGASNQSWGQTQNAPTYDATNGYFKWNTCTLTANTDYKFKLCTYNTWSYYNYQDGSSVTVTNGTKQTTDGDKNIIFRSTHAGVAVVTLNPTDNAMVIHCPYQISYAAGTGASGSVSASAITTYGSTCALSSSTFTKTGYTQDGWATSNGGAKVYNLGATYTGGYTDATLYPHWNPNTYTITLNGNGGAGHTANVTATYNSSTLASITNPEKSGYTFAGWYTNTDGTGTMLIDVEGHLTPSIDGYTDGTGKWIATAGTNLYARWKANASVGTYNFQYGSGTFYSSTWSLLNFGAAENHKRTVDWTLIDPTDKKFYVGYDGDFWTAGINGAAYGSSEEKNLSDLRLAPGTLTVGTATGAVGKLVIFDDSNAKNLYAGFQPNGYGLTYAGGSKAFSEVGDNMWQTEIVTITAEDVAGTFKVGLETASPGTYIDCSTMTATDNAAALNTRKDALVSEQSYPAIPDLAAGQEGRFVIWDNDTHTGQQWYLSFLPVYTITYNANGAETGSVPTDANKYRTNETLTVLGNTGSLAKTGYAFSGWNTAADGSGTTYVAGANLAKIGSNVVLYAQFEKAQITALTLSSGVVESNTPVTATLVIDPSPAGNTKLCWKILRSNGNLLTDEGFTPLSGNAVRFNAPTAGGTYKVACVLRTGSSCSGGTVLDSVVTDLVVASAHTVTIRYQDSEGRSLAAPVEMTGLPLEWSTAINPPSITGYNFTRWEAGDGIFISTDRSTKIEEGTTTTPTIYMKSQYDGTLTAVYSKKRMIYFNNTLGWSNVYVYFYKNNSYWDNSGKDWGTGANTGYTYTDTPYSEGKHGKMIQIPGTNIYYFDAESAGVNASYKDIVFTEADQHNYGYFSDTKVVRRGDYKSSLPMFVPLSGQTPVTHNTNAKYYNEGYWMNYPENTGYTLHIYSGTAKEVLDEIRSVAFPFTADKTMPMEVTLELNANTTYGYEIHRADGAYYGKSGTLKINASGDEGESPVKLAASTRGGIKTSAAGDYTFKLNFGESSGYGYLFGVHYPASVGSYRLVYKDLAEWSQGSAHTDSWSHPSRVIYKNEGAADTVSFFVAKGHTPTIQIQKITSIDSEGNITWTNVGSAVSYDSVSAAGVYNFITSQTADALTIDKVEPYTGNYYIRTGAVDGGWDNYRTGSDHLMTYSAFSEDRAQNTFGELFSHYKAKWCPRGTNVVFCIANDYSSCISDTLVQDVGNRYNNIYPANDGTRPGELKAESYSGTTINSSETGDKYSANIRFMWNRSTNKISRAYVSSSTNTDKKFLVLKGGAEFWNSDGSDLTGDGENHANKEAIFQDNENWIYEREIKVTTGTRFKLYACYAETTPSEENAQYFRGAYDGGNIDNNTNSIILINGNGSGTCNARLIYDFKTNRLIAAYLPDGSAVSEETAIHADLMVIREHQGEGQQITFNTGGSLTEVKTVYGVMRFNRWILNNRQHPEDHLKEHCETDEAIRTHHPLVDAGSMKSSDERGLYWISFPFDVNLSEVFGFGTYGVHWIIMRYNGAARAAQGYWADSEGFWEYIEDRNGVVLKGGMGYVLALDLDLMQATDRTFWSHDIQQIELFFPSTSIAGTIKQTTATVEVPAHTCTIDRTNSGGTSPDINKNRTKVDSHWNIIGVPSFANYGTTLTDEGSTVTWKDNSALDWTNDLPFLYEWNANDNTYTVQSGSSYPFKAMHAYYVQYHGTLTWSLASATTSSPIVARRTYAEEPKSEEFRLELRRNDKMEDQTFVKMSNDENASANFVFGEDLTKEKNTKKANIYTLVEGYIPVAGNTLPMSNQTTIVPVGVSIKSTGDYTFSIPEGTDGVGVTLVDNETGVRTSLSALDYTVSLGAGTHDQRFTLEISPIQNTPTGIDEVPSDQVPSTKVRKVMIDGVLYIVRDGKIFDARGARVE